MATKPGLASHKDVKKKKNLNFVSRFTAGSYDFVKSFDDFGTPVTFNYKGNDSFQTMPGALISLVMKIFMSYFIYLKIVNLINNQDWIIGQQILNNSPDDLRQPVNLGDFENFTIGFELNVNRGDTVSMNQS